MSHPAPNPVPNKPPVGLYGGNVLFAAPESWDEACFSAPALRAIRSARPTCTLGVICHERQLEFWQSIHGINDIITYQDRSSARSIMREQAQSRYTWESAILWEHNVAADYCYAAKIKQRLGYPAKSLQKYLTDEVLVPTVVGPTEHRVQHYLRFMTKLNVPTQKPELFMPANLGIPQVPGAVLVCPESDYGPHYEWSLERWSEIMGLLITNLHAKVLVAGHPGSRTGLATRLAKLFPSDCQYAMLDPIAPALPIIAAHSLVIAADSSISHLSAHVGVTTISLFGPNDPAWRRPLGRQHAFVRHKTECAPCLLKKCYFDLRCQKEMTYEDVARAIMMKYPMI